MGKILIVEDEFDSLEVLALLLEVMGHSVTMARDGMEGLEKAKTERPQVIVTDWMMPRLDGVAMCERLRAQEETRTIPIILMSAAAEPDHHVKPYDAYLTKPANLENLEQTIVRLLASEQ